MTPRTTRTFGRGGLRSGLAEGYSEDPQSRFGYAIAMSERPIDCVVCGSCVVDILVRPVALNEAIGGGRLVRVEPIELSPGGIVSNASMAMAKLGRRAAVFTYVGDDDWARLLRRRYEEAGVDGSPLVTHATAATSVTVVAIDGSGERTFLHSVGAPRMLDAGVFLDRLELFARSRFALIGYYSLMPNVEGDLPRVLRAIRQTGCRTALDAAGDGGTMNPLAACLPYLDAYVPSHGEASGQTGETDPRRIVDRYRSCGATGLLGVKLGADGALLSPAAGHYIDIAPVAPPGEVVDTTGAGDCFYGGLLTGLLAGMSVADAGRLAAAAGACSVTRKGATAGLVGYNHACRLAGVDPR